MGNDPIKYPLTKERLEQAAKQLAETCNGGKWLTHYTEEQRHLWRYRIWCIMVVGRLPQ